MTGPAATVKVTCPSCGHVRVPARGVRLVLGSAPYYTFRCPSCGARVRRSAGEPVVSLLVRGGVPSMRVG